MALNIPDLIAHPQKLADRVVVHELKELLEQYPFFQAARLLYLKALYQLRDPSFGDELCRTALYVADRRSLFYLIEGDYYTLRPVARKASSKAEQGEGAEPDRTQLLIDAFLSGLPTEPEEAEEQPLDDGGLSLDYTPYVLRAEDLEEATTPEEAQHTEVCPMKGQNLIDDFIQNSDEKIDNPTDAPLMPEPQDKPEELPGVEEDDGYFTETLAKIYIKQHRYAKALEIIRRLSLKYPKKNAYFADQIRFLEKLVINSNDK